MSPNELAAELFKEKIGICHVAATMLRAQQAEIESEKLYSSMKHDEVLAMKAEIEALKRGNEATALLNYNKGHEDGRKLVIPSPLKDREADRLRFSDEAFNRWLDEGISDSGHTVYDLVENVCEAWHGWENSQYYTHPVKELTDEEIQEVIDEFTEDVGYLDGSDLDTFARAILEKASEK